ncbi:MAG: hypothetical protein ACHQ53_11435 [Polyangiales bacterium]
MPSFQVMLVRLNHITTAEGLAAYKKEFGAKPMPEDKWLAGFTTKPFERKFAQSVPAGLQAAIRAVLLRNLERKEPFAVTWAWKPSYDYELSIWECEDTKVSKGGITILIGTRYPLDGHPGDIGKGKAKTKRARKG